MVVGSSHGSSGAGFESSGDETVAWNDWDETVGCGGAVHVECDASLSVDKVVVFTIGGRSC